MRTGTKSDGDGLGAGRPHRWRKGPADHADPDASGASVVADCEARTAGSGYR